MTLQERLVSDALKIAHYSHKEDEDQVTIYHLNEAELQYIILHTIEQTIKEGNKDLLEMAEREIYALENTLERSKELSVAIGHKRVYERIKLISEYKGKLKAWEEIKETLTDTQHALRGIIK